MSVLLTVAALTLMLPIRMKTHFVLVRPFEFIVALAVIGWPMIAARRGVRFPAGLLLLLPFFVWHVFSAELGGGLHNAAREGLQVVVVTTFAFLLAQETSRLDMPHLTRLLLSGTTVIMGGTILWHIANGHLVGWKQLPDPLLSFVFLPPLLAGVILFSDAARRRGLWFAWAALFPILIMSGERKALIIYLVLSALLVARGRLALVLPAVAAGFVVLFVLSTVISNAYLQRQVRTIVDPGGTGNYEYVIATGRYLPGETPSDVQRAFALHMSRQLFAEHPLFGVGTNQYVKIIDETFPNLPSDMRLGIHGEFQTALTENGLVGLTLYLLVWLAAFVRLIRQVRDAFHKGRLTAMQTRTLPLLLFIPFALFLGTEAPGTRAFVGIIIISLLPELASGALARTGRRVAVRSGAVRPLVPPLSAPGVAR